MKINANVLRMLEYYFSKITWYKNYEGSRDRPELTEEILYKLFWRLGVTEPATITLISFKENTLAARGLNEGFTLVFVDVLAEEPEDYIHFEYRYLVDPVLMKEEENVKINFNGFHFFRKFYYDFYSQKWELFG